MAGRQDEAQLLADLRELYEAADALYAGWACPTSTECCRFGVTGREPYVTSIELCAIARALGRRGGRLSAGKRALPITRDAPRERICPLLDRGGRCSVYAERPLGCRTYYCARGHGESRPRRAQLRALVERLRAIAARHGQGGEAGRPLTRALAE